jgi:hypothetical protein
VFMVFKIGISTVTKLPWHLFFCVSTSN